MMTETSSDLPIANPEALKLSIIWNRKGYVMSFWGYLISFGILCAAFYLLYITRYRRRENDERIPTFICSECGERHCSCHKEDESKSGRDMHQSDGGKE